MDGRRSSRIWLKAIGVVLLAGSFYLFFRSYADNTFLSPLVGIQEERKQTVVTTGVYGFIRRPMYLGAVLMLVGVAGVDGVGVRGACGVGGHSSSDGEDSGGGEVAHKRTGRIQGIFA